MPTIDIDSQLVLATFAFNTLSRVRRARPALAPRFFAAFDTWALETLAGRVDRRIPVAAIDFETMDREQGIDELTRFFGGTIEADLALGA